MAMTGAERTRLHRARRKAEATAMSPLRLLMAVHFATGTEPEWNVVPAIWNSEEGGRARDWLRQERLIDDAGQADGDFILWGAVCWLVSDRLAPWGSAAGRGW